MWGDVSKAACVQVSLYAVRPGLSWSSTSSVAWKGQALDGVDTGRGTDSVSVPSKALCAEGH